MQLSASLQVDVKMGESVSFQVSAAVLQAGPGRNAIKVNMNYYLIL